MKRLLVGLALVVCVPLLVNAEPRLDDALAQYYGLRGWPVPAVDSLLEESARARATVLAAQGELTHEDQAGRGPADQMLARGGGPGTYGEILGAGTALELVWKAWLASPRHRAVLDEPDWQRWGWGRAARGASWVWVVRFWKP